LHVLNVFSESDDGINEDSYSLFFMMVGPLFQRFRNPGGFLNLPLTHIRPFVNFPYDGPSLFFKRSRNPVKGRPCMSLEEWAF